MNSETNQEGVVTPIINEGEGEAKVEVETVAIPKTDWDKMNETVGSLKRELKDLKKPVEKTSSKNDKSSDNVPLERLEKIVLKQAGLDHADDIELARNTAKKWGVDIEEVLVDEDFKVKLERQQTSRANTIATSGIRSGAGTSQAKNTPEYWVQKGTPPTPADVPDRKTRATILRAMMANGKSGGKKFYNE